MPARLVKGEDCPDGAFMADTDQDSQQHRREISRDRAAGTAPPGVSGEEEVGVWAIGLILFALIVRLLVGVFQAFTDR